MLRRTLFLVACLGITGALHPYCDRNETISTWKPIAKTRIITKRPSKWKFWKKSETFTEEFVEQEERITHKLISACCQGYRMTELQICEPVCERGCPAYASCVEPNRCQCKQGYISAVSHKDGSHYCEPICDAACPSGTLCVAPNKCACKDGYQPLNADIEGGECRALCTHGDGCQNGACVAAEECVCNRGFVWDEVTESCIAFEESGFSDDDDEYGILSTESIVVSAANDAATDTTLVPNTMAVVECPSGFLLYKGDCRAETFNSNVSDNCKFSSCGDHQICLENGTCSCKEGYALQSADNVDGVGPACQLFISGSESASANTQNNAMWLIIIGVITICGTILLAVGSIAVLKRRRQQAVLRDVEAKAEYSNQRDERPWVL